MAKGEAHQDGSFCPVSLTEVISFDRPWAYSPRFTASKGHPVKVKSVIATGERCPCGTRLQHWEMATGQRASRCASNGCRRPAAGGGNVVKAGSAADRSLYVVPLCSPCNGQSEEFDVDLPLVLSTAQATCGYGERQRAGMPGQAEDSNQALVAALGARHRS